MHLNCRGMELVCTQSVEVTFCGQLMTVDDESVPSRGAFAAKTSKGQRRVISDTSQALRLKPFAEAMLR